MKNRKANGNDFFEHAIFSMLGTVRPLGPADGKKVIVIDSEVWEIISKVGIDLLRIANVANRLEKDKKLPEELSKLVREYTSNWK
jgi:hypothetical protein